MSLASGGSGATREKLGLCGFGLARWLWPVAPTVPDGGLSGCSFERRHSPAMPTMAPASWQEGPSLTFSSRGCAGFSGGGTRGRVATSQMHLAELFLYLVASSRKGSAHV